MSIEGSNLAQDPGSSGELSNRQLKYAYWITTHKEELKKLGLRIWMVADALLIGMAIWGAVNFVIGVKQDQAAIAELVNLDATFTGVRELPQPLVVRSIDRVLSGDGKADIVAVVYNPNQGWGAKRMSYYFTLAGTPQPLQDGYILPNAEHTFVLFGASSSGEASFLVGDVQWRHVRASDVRDDGIETSNPQIVRPAPTLPARLQFLAKNTSVQGYWNVEFLVIGYLGDRLVGVSKVSAGPFEFGKETLVDVPLSGSIAGASRFIIEPQVDIFDPSVFMPVVVEGSGEIK